MKKIVEKERELPVIYDGYEIAVVGGGIAGVAAALALSSPGEEGKIGLRGGGVWRKAVDRPLPVLAQGNGRSLA